MKLQKLLILITFVMGLLFAIAFAFNLIPEETLLQLQAQLNFNLEQYLAQLTAYSGAGFGVALAGSLSRASNERANKVWTVRTKQQDELYNKSRAEFNNSIQLKQQELDLEAEKNRLEAERNRLLKTRMKSISTKSYFDEGERND